MHRLVAKCTYWKNLVSIRLKRARHRRALLTIVAAIERYKRLASRYGADSRMLQVCLLLVGPQKERLPVLTNHMDKELKFFNSHRQLTLDKLDQVTRKLEILNSRSRPELLTREIEEASALQRWYAKELQWDEYMLQIINRVC